MQQFSSTDTLKTKKTFFFIIDTWGEFLCMFKNRAVLQASSPGAQSTLEFFPAVSLSFSWVSEHPAAADCRRLRTVCQESSSLTKAQTDRASVHALGCELHQSHSVCLLFVSVCRSHHTQSCSNVGFSKRGPHLYKSALRMLWQRLCSSLTYVRAV